MKVSRRYLDLLVFLGCLLFATWLMTFTFQTHQGTIRMASKVWSDFAAHLPLIRSFSLGSNFPPEYPTFPGEPIRYHYLFYLLVGLLEKMGFSLSLALNLPSILGFTLLLWLIYQTTRLFFDSRFSGLLALYLFLFNGSFTFMEYLRRSGSLFTALLKLPRLPHFVSFGPWDGQLISAFWNLNIYTNQRHLGLSFGLALVALYPFLRLLVKRHRPSRLWLMLLPLIMFLMPFLHQAAFLIIWFTTVTITFLDLRHLKLYLPLLFALVLGSLPGLLLAPRQHLDTLAFQPGFLAPNLQPLPLLKYWYWNLGLYLPLSPLLFLWLKKPGRVFLIALLPLFLLANLFRLSPDMINNHKLFNFFLLGLVITSSGYLHFLLKQSLLTALPTLGLIFCLSFSGWVDFFPIVNDSFLEITDLPLNPTAAWILNHTPPQSVFLTTSYLYNPASVAGRKTFEDYGYFNWSMGYNDSNRRQQLAYLFSPNLPLASVCRYLSANQIDYVLLSPGLGDLGALNPQVSTIAKSMRSAYQSPEGFSLYAVKSNCP